MAIGRNAAATRTNGCVGGCLRQRTREMKPGFLDMFGPWGKYVRESGRELAWFKRDPVHANGRGEQVLGRVLAEYLTPKPRETKRNTRGSDGSFTKRIALTAMPFKYGSDVGVRRNEFLRCTACGHMSFGHKSAIARLAIPARSGLI